MHVYSKREKTRVRILNKGLLEKHKPFLDQALGLYNSRKNVNHDFFFFCLELIHNSLARFFHKMFIALMKKQV